MPTQVYGFDPVTRRVRVVATDFIKCNGIAISEDGKLAYMYVFRFFNFSHFGFTLRLRIIILDQILPLPVHHLETTRPYLLLCKSNSTQFFKIYLILIHPLPHYGPQIRIRCGSQ